MDEKTNSLHLALDDLHLIRQVLDRTTDSFRALAPSFFRMGLVWLVYALLYTAATGPDILNYLLPGLSLKGLGAYFSLIQWLRVPLALYLVAECVLWQRKKFAYAALSRQLVGVWQVLLLLYLVLLALFQWEVSSLQAVTMVSGETETMQLWSNFAVCGAFLAFLPAIFPGFPLVATGVLLREKVLGGLGVVVILFGIASLLGTLTDGGNLLVLPLVLTAISMVAAFFQPAALLLTALRLRRRRERALPGMEKT